MFSGSGMVKNIKKKLGNIMLKGYWDINTGHS